MQNLVKILTLDFKILDKVGRGSDVEARTGNAPVYQVLQTCA